MGRERDRDLSSRLLSPRPEPARRNIGAPTRTAHDRRRRRIPGLEPNGSARAHFLKGRALLEDITGRPIDGFVAPAWLYGEGAREAMIECAIPLAEDHLRVWSPASGAQLAWGPVITWASRTRARLVSSLVASALLRHVPLNVLRIGVHPPDSRHKALVQSIDKTFKAASRGRRPGRYSDLVSSDFRRDLQ